MSESKPSKPLPDPLAEIAMEDDPGLLGTGFALPWETTTTKHAAPTDLNSLAFPDVWNAANPATEAQSVGALPDWLAPAPVASPAPVENLNSTEADPFDLFAVLGLPKQSSESANQNELTEESSTERLPIPTDQTHIAEFEEESNNDSRLLRPTAEALQTPKRKELRELLLRIHQANFTPSELQQLGFTNQETDRPTHDLSEQYITVFLGGQEYAIALPGIVEVGKPPKLTPLPFVPAWVLGLMNFRGEVHPVIDLRLYFNLKATTRAAERLLVYRSEAGVNVGFLVDRFGGLKRLPSTAERKPFAGPATGMTRFIQNTIYYQDTWLPVLDLALLNADALLVPAAVPA